METLRIRIEYFPITNCFTILRHVLNNLTSVLCFDYLFNFSYLGGKRLLFLCSLISGNSASFFVMDFKIGGASGVVSGELSYLNHRK